jgi:hypothetical protein
MARDFVRAEAGQGLGRLAGDRSLPGFVGDPADTTMGDSGVPTWLRSQRASKLMRLPRGSATEGASRNRTRGAIAAAGPPSPAHLRNILPISVEGRTPPARKRVSLMQQIRRLAGVGTLIAPPRRPRMRSRFKAMCRLRAPHWAPLVSILELLRQSADVLDGWPLPDSDRDRPSNRERIKGPPARHGCSSA